MSTTSVTTPKKKKNILSKVIAGFLFLWPILWTIALMTEQYFDFSFQLQAEDLLSLFFYSILLALIFVKPMPLKIILAVVNAVFLTAMIFILLPYMSAEPLMIFVKIICPFWPIELFS